MNIHDHIVFQNWELRINTFVDLKYVKITSLKTSILKDTLKHESNILTFIIN